MDVTGQTDSDSVTVIVKPAPDSPPVANAGPDVTVRLPTNSVILNGSESKDDRGIVSYLWENVSPSGLSAYINGTDNMVLRVNQLLEGTYVFKLTVTDTTGQTASDNATIHVQPELIPPKANAGPDVTVNLPTNSTTLDGSTSSDDKGIVQYLWKKISPNDLSVDMMGTDNKVLTLTNLYAGIYVFSLTVTDNVGLKDTDNVTVTVVSACLTTTSSVCAKRGFGQTKFPNSFNLTTATEAAESFKEIAASVFNHICQEDALTYLCSLYFPKCNPQTGSLESPCKSLCQEAVTTCGNYFSNPFPCEVFQETDCLNRITSTTSAPTTVPPKGTCEVTQVQDCINLGFNQTSFPNFIYEEYQSSAIETFNGYFVPVINSGCHPDQLFFICSLQFPKCSDGKNVKPCRRTCEAVTANCSFIAQFVQCSAFTDYDCMAPTEPTAVCGVDKFTCGRVSKCVNESLLCNGINDCGDWTDEMDCVCKEFSYQCKMGMCIKSYQRCDGVEQCPDGSDEASCNNCTKGQVMCPNGICIMSEWLCDGRAECDDGWDEFNCDICGPDQFTCGDANNTCVDLSQRCDSVPDCPQGFDEYNCIKQENGYLQLSYKKYWLPLCSDAWDDSFGEYICTLLLGEGSYINKTDVVNNVYAFAKLSFDGVETVPSLLGPIVLNGSCPNNHVVRVNCNPRGCGKTLVDKANSFIVNGNDATPGAWPWQVALYYGNQFFCGGALISSNFVLTAAHCVQKYTAKYLKVRLGALNSKVPEATIVEIAVEDFKVHEDFVDFITNDIALIRLAMHVTFTDYIQPICLPTADELLPLHSECYSLGWGKLKYDGDYSEILQQLKMVLWDTEKCNSSIAWNGQIYGTISICAGYYSGVRTICRGDSGGPLVCLDAQNTWKVFGIASYVGNYCNLTERPNVYTNVRQLLDWIQTNTECKFQCDNGKCLYESEFLCDRINQCGDNSDEIRPCIAEMTVTCAFEDKFLCGYEFNGWNIASENRFAVSSDDPSFARPYTPQFDHSIGHYPGKFFYGRLQTVTNAELLTPRFSTTGQTCIRFSYYQRGSISLGLSVYVNEFTRGGGATNYTTTRQWFSGVGASRSLDEWRTGYFDMSLGEFRLKFLTGDLLQTAIDDVKMLPGMCSDVLCDNTTEYRCDGKEKMCIAKQSECNLVVDCEAAADEKHCSSRRSYTCTFENGNLCALYQKGDDEWDWWLINVTLARSLSGNQNFVDRSTMSSDGYVLYVNTFGLPNLAHIEMWQKFYLKSEQFCFMFYYIKNSHATFDIHIDCDGCNRTTYEAKSTYVDIWTRFQINLPTVDLVNVTYDIIGTNAVGNKYYIALDDIFVKTGVCPTYVCPANYTKCTTIDRCIPKTSICDRKVDCADESDETACECTADERKCNSGLCIPKSQFCDRIQHCSDGSDESSICDNLRSVSCTFEQPYICGYTVQHYTEFQWARVNGSAFEKLTGPENDHTYRNKSGHFMSTNGNDGNNGDNSSLFSPEFFTSVGQSVEFYYHIYHAFIYQGFDYPGFLDFSLELTNSSEKSSQWQAPVDNLANEWMRVCVNLPDKVLVRLVFTVIRNETTVGGVDIAIDDLKLNNSTCSESSTTVPLTTVSTTTSGPKTCRPDQFDCGEGTCIDGTYRCDGEKDCPGQGLDEIGCKFT